MRHAPSHRVAPLRVLGFNDQCAEQPVDVGAVLAAGVVPAVVEGEHALVYTAPMVGPAGARRHQAARVVTNVRAVGMPHVVATRHEMNADRAVSAKPPVDLT